MKLHRPGHMMLLALLLCVPQLLAAAGGEENKSASDKDNAVPHRMHGVNIFGEKYLKYKDETGTYPCVNPNAPKGGSITIVEDDAYTSLNPYALNMTPVPGAALPFESLGTGSLDSEDDLSVYCLLAESIEIAPDRKSIMIYLRPEARFSDGVPMTSEDVIFSWQISKDPGCVPQLRSLMSLDVEDFIAVDTHTVKVLLKRYVRETPITVLTTLSIMPKHIYGRPGTDFGKDFNDFPPVGTGAYTLEKYDKSAFATWKRDPNYWGKDLWLNKGLHNFDRITYKVVKERSKRLEELKAGNIDVLDINSARDWAEEFKPENNSSIRMGHLVRLVEMTNQLPPIQSYSYNLRRDVFKDYRVRKAISAVFDFEKLNQNLFYMSYTRQRCFYDAPGMASFGPADGRLREILVDLARRHNKPDSDIVHVPMECITVGPRVMGEDVTNRMAPIEERIAQAAQYLEDAGYLIDSKDRVRKKNGVPLRFELLSYAGGKTIETTDDWRKNLARIGVEMVVKEVQIPEYMQRITKYDYDMMGSNYYASKSPGAELLTYWYSQGADMPGGMNLTGLKNPAVDEVIEHINGVEDRDEVYLYTQVLDRLLWCNNVFIPQWHCPQHRGYYWKYLGRPKLYCPTMRYVMYNAPLLWWEEPGVREAVTAERNSAQSGGRVVAAVTVIVLIVGTVLITVLSLFRKAKPKEYVKED